MSAQDEDTDDLVRISELAQERRDAATAQLTRELPEIITDVDQTEIAYTFEPSALPLSQVDVEKFVRAMESTFGLTLRTPDIGPLLKDFTRDEILEMTPLDSVSALFRTNRGSVAFENGRFSVGRDDFVPLQSVRMTREQVLVGVKGIGEHAELVAAEVMELIWACTGAPKRWESIEPKLQIRGYATATFVDLGFPFERILNPTLVGFLNSELIDGKRYAAHAGDYLMRDDFKPPPGSVLSWALASIHLKVYRFDRRNGRHGDTDLQFRVPTMGDYGSSNVHITSELPFDEHVSCVVDLSRAVLNDVTPRQ